MKKRLLPTLLVLCMALTLLPGTTWAEETSVQDSEFPAAIQVTEETFYDTVAIYVENRNVWKEKPISMTEQRYGLIDLEGDGIPELFSSSLGGSAFISQNNYYKIDVDKRIVYEVQDYPAELEMINIINGLKIFRDKRTDQLLYYYKDFARNGSRYNVTKYGFFYKHDNIISSKPLWIRDFADGKYTYSYYTDSEELVEVSEEEWNQYQENYLSQYALIAENVPTSEIKTMNNANDEKLEDILRDLYDKLYQIKLDSIDYLAFSDLSYNESGSASIGKNVRTMIGDQWDSKWPDTDILYSELYSNISPWIVYDYRNSLLTGFAAYAFKHPLLNKIVIAYRGSRNPFDIFNSDSVLDRVDVVTDWILNDIKMFRGEQGSQLQNAFDFYDSVKAKSGCENIAVTGHSLGGGLADIIAAYDGCEGQSFNSAPFLDIAYWYLYPEMSKQFMGVDQLNFLAHVNEDDTWVGNQKSELIKPKVLYAHRYLSNYDDLSPLKKIDYNHSMRSIVTKESNGGVSMGTIVDRQTEKSVVTQWATGIKGYVTLGTSKDDRLKFQGILKKWSDYAIYSGNGYDVIQAARSSDLICGGKGDDDIDGNRGNDTYIYHKGDGQDVITDISGQDELVVYGFPSYSRITTKVMGDYVRVSVGNSIIAEISTTRSNKKSNSFLVRLDGADEALEINDLLTSRVGHTKTVSICCPVNVEVLDDASGAVVHTLCDGKEETSHTQYGNFYVYPDEDGEYVKYLDLFDDCSVRIAGIGDGNMDILVQDIGDDLYDPNPFVAENVPVTSNTIATIEENTETGEKTLLIDTDGDGTTDTAYPLREENPCAEGHHWNRGIVIAEAEDKFLYTCSVCGETKYEGVTPSAPVPAYTITLNTSPFGDGNIHYTVSSTLTNAKDVYLIATLYEAGGKLRKVEMQPHTLMGEYTGTLPFKIDSASLDSVKVFLLDRADFVPLCEVCSFPKPTVG